MGAAQGIWLCRKRSAWPLGWRLLAPFGKSTAWRWSMAVDFKRPWFAKEVILQCIPCYLACKLSYRDLEEMLAERGTVVDHSTIHRWVVRYLLTLEAEFRRGKRPVCGNWWVDALTSKSKGPGSISAKSSTWTVRPSATCSSPRGSCACFRVIAPFGNGPQCWMGRQA